MHLRDYIELQLAAEQQLGEALAALAQYHSEDPEIQDMGQLLASWCDWHVQALRQLSQRYLLAERLGPELTIPVFFLGPRSGRFGLLRDLHESWVMAQDVHLRWTVLGQAARASHEAVLEAACAELGAETDRQLAWLRTRIEATAPQALIAEG